MKLYRLVLVAGSAAFTAYCWMSNGASSHPRRLIGHAGFSEVYVPQVQGRVPASATSAKSITPKTLPEGRAVTFSGSSSPATCGPQNADSPACRKTAAQQTHR